MLPDRESEREREREREREEGEGVGWCGGRLNWTMYKAACESSSFYPLKHRQLGLHISFMHLGQ